MEKDAPTHIYNVCGNNIMHIFYQKMKKKKKKEGVVLPVTK